MKTLILAAVIIISFATLSCSPAKSDGAAVADTTQAQAVTTIAPINVVTWNEVGVRATPGEKGKYVTSVYLGEHVELAGDTASEVSGSKRNHYHKVILADGNAGWIRDEFLAVDVHPAAVMAEAQIYKRPDIATVTEKSFATGDFIVVKKVEGEFVEVSGKLEGEKWFTTGFIQARNISYTPIEVQYVALKRRAAEETKEKVKTALQAQLINSDIFGESNLWIFDNTDQGPRQIYNPDAFELNPPREGLVAFYAMNAADTKDYSGNGYDGEGINVSPGLDMMQAQEAAMDFDGSTSYISVPGLAGEALHPPFSVFASMTMTDFKAKEMQTIVSKGRSVDGTAFNLGHIVKETGQRFFTFGLIGTKPVGAEAPTTVTGEWVSLAATFDMKEAKLYVNGELVATTPISQEDADVIDMNFVNSPQPLEIGRELRTLDRYFKGTIDNVAIWNRALSAEEIKAISL